MAFYELRPSCVEAVQYTKDKWYEVISFTEGEIEVIEDKLYLNNYLLEEGDYIVREKPNFYIIYPEDEFIKKYQLMNGEINGKDL